MTNPYSWDVGNLAAGESGTIELTLTMNTSNTAGQTITAGARITTAYEAYLPNNQIDLAFFVGKKVLLPLFTH